jgi:hypothetical protein
MQPEKPKRGWWSAWQQQAGEEPIGERLLESRIQRVEREVRIYRGLFVLAALALAGLGSLHLMRPAAPVGDLLRAHRIEVLDKQGRLAVELDSDTLGGRIALRYSGKDGDPPPPAMFLASEPNGGSLQMFEPGQNFYALNLGIGDAGQGVVSVRRRGMQPGAELRGPASDASGGELLVYNKDGNPAVHLASDAAGKGTVTTQGRP